MLFPLAAFSLRLVGAWALKGLNALTRY